MEELKHTPGPWIVGILADKIVISPKSVMGNACNLVLAEVKINEKANAHLIATAPELLKALEQIRDFDPDESDYDDPGQIAIEAINKAKGIIK